MITGNRLIKSNTLKMETHLKETFQYTDYQIKLIKYSIKAILSESSKLILLSAYFLYIHQLPGFLSAVAVLMLLRCNSGGIHCKHYITCFLFTFMVLNLSVIILPAIYCPGTLHMMVMLIICMAVTHLTGPVASIRRPTPNAILIKKCRTSAAAFLFIYFLLVMMIPDNKLITIGFWTILIQTVQLVAARLQKGDNTVYEIQTQKGSARSL